MSQGARAKRREEQKRKNQEHAEAKLDRANAKLAKAAAHQVPMVDPPPPVPMPGRMRRGLRYLAAHKGTATALVVSICTLAVTAYQGYVARKGLAEQTAATRAQVRTFELQMRPWLNATDFQAPRLDGSPDDMARFEIHNVGQLPAFATYTGCVSIVEKKTISDHPPTEKELCPHGPQVLDKITLLAAGPSQTIYPGIPMRGYDAHGNANDVTAMLGSVNSGASALFICMRFDFTGPDRHEQPHHIYWACMQYDPGKKSWVQHVPPEVDRELP